MKSCLFPPGRVALVVNSSLFTPPAPAAHTGLQAGVRSASASGMPLEFPAPPLPDEKIHRFHLARYGLGLV
jgi:hypothetical protein